MDLPALGLTLVLAWVVPSAVAHAALPVVPPPDPILIPIIDGAVVPECAWPSVVALYGTALEGSARCTGFYIGGRVILTAAHCVVPGFHVDPADGKDECTTDADCPDEDAFGEPLTVTCPAAGSDFCRDPDLTKSSDLGTALFGETYPNEGVDGHIRRSVEIAYCRRRNLEPEDVVKGTSNDIAYCILRQPPNVQPIPIAMDCEVAPLLVEGTSVISVGFGQSDPPVGSRAVASSAWQHRHYPLL